MAVLMAWQPGHDLTSRFDSAWEVLSALLGHQRRPGKTYQGWVKAWIKWSPRMLALITPHLRMLIQTMAAANGCWMTAPGTSPGTAPGTSEGWVLFGCDGTRIDAPRTVANEKAFGCAGKVKTTPQLWLTLVMHLGTGLPWCWKIGKAKASERDHLRQMIHLLPRQAMLIADAGYTGYELWRMLIDSGRSILIRAGANVHLLRKLGYEVREYEDTVYLWPEKQRKRGRAPLALRLIRLHDGRKDMCLLTNVLDSRKLSDQQAAKFYRLRWGLELWYRAMKQTMRRRKLASTAPVQAALELRWAVVALACLGLLQVRALLEQGATCGGTCQGASRGNPHRASVAGALKVVRAIMRQPNRRFRRHQQLSRRLSQAVRDTYERKAPKAARDWPHPKKQQPPGNPNLRPASGMEIHAAQQLKLRHAA